MGHVCLGFDHSGHDMQPRTEDRHLLYLAAWIEAKDEDEDDCEDRPECPKLAEASDARLAPPGRRSAARAFLL